MIHRLSNQPVKTVFTGLRPGDKLSEELMSQEELRSATTWMTSLFWKRPRLTLFYLRSRISALEESAHAFDEDKLMAALRSLVPEFEMAEQAASQ